MANRQIITIMKVKLLRIGFAINNNDHDPGMAGKPCYKIHSLFFLDYVVGYDVLYVCDNIPANKDSRYSTLFPRVQRFMIIIASVSMTSGIVLTLVNTKFSIKTLFGSSWGYAILTGATISVFIYTHILIQNRRSRTTTTAAVSSSSSLLIPSTSISLRKNNKNTINNNKNSQKGKYQNDSSHGYSSFCLQLLLH
jgi:low affinity Fe/Cu permease